ncbi:MAG: hypothetical protein OXG72_16845 [Acidobacteria bacterium]|nr:hypothetical protein [Acidobacteriota bacterium]
MRRFAEVDADGHILRFSDGRIRTWIQFSGDGRLLDAEGRILTLRDEEKKDPTPRTRLVPCDFDWPWRARPAATP